MPRVAVFFRREEESWAGFARRITEGGEEGIAVLSAADALALEGSQDELQTFLSAVAPVQARVRIATRSTGLAAAARREGIRVLDRAQFLKEALEGHESREEALRIFSPHVWRQELRSRLQALGLLSLPKVRVWVLIGTSVTLFFFVVLRLLPSAEIRVWPREDPLSQTANIFLVLSGATVDIPPRVRTMPLIPIRVDVRKSLTFDQISKEFIGTSAEVPMAIVNRSDERYSFRDNTRLMNQAGMIFFIQEPVNVDAGQEVTVHARAADIDLYGEIIGGRGNVPAGLKWDFPGLAPEERLLVYGENRTESRGGTTAYRTVLQKSDLRLARTRLEQELLAMAKQLTDEERVVRNMEQEKGRLEMLYYDELTQLAFSGFILPTQFLGEPVQSVPVEGGITYTMYAYDAGALLTLLSDELRSHVGEGKRLIPESISFERLIVHVIDYADDLSWVKLTVDLTGAEQFVLDPLTPTGARFGKKVREAVSRMKREEAMRILKNFPEVEKVEISLWPPWQPRLPTILSQIGIAPVTK